jgi:hypothetical protein
MLTPSPRGYARPSPRGYSCRRYSGMGQNGTDTTDGSVPIITDTPPVLDGSLPGALPGTTTPSPTIPGASSAPIAPPSPWEQLLINLGLTAGKTTTAIALQSTNPLYRAAGQPGYYYATGPGGTVVSTSGVPGALNLTAANLSSWMPLILIGGGLLVFMSMGRR